MWREEEEKCNNSFPPFFNSRLSRRRLFLIPLNEIKLSFYFTLPQPNPACPIRWFHSLGVRPPHSLIHSLAIVLWKLSSEWCMGFFFSLSLFFSSSSRTIREIISSPFSPLFQRNVEMNERSRNWNENGTCKNRQRSIKQKLKGLGIIHIRLERLFFLHKCSMQDFGVSARQDRLYCWRFKHFVYIDQFPFYSCYLGGCWWKITLGRWMLGPLCYCYC